MDASLGMGANAERRQPKLQRVASAVVRVAIQRRLDHKRAGHVLEIVEMSDIGRVRCLEDPVVRA